MSYLINGLSGISCPNIDAPLKQFLSFSTTCAINKNIRILMEKCMNEVSKQMKEEGMFDRPHLIPTASVIISDKDRVTLSLYKDECAITTHLIVYNITKMCQYNELMQCLMITEELCHLFWNIKSEFDVNFKVYEILKRIYPKLKLFELYKKETMIAEGAKEGKTIPLEYFDQ